MPRRALFSFLIALTGNLVASAVPAGAETGHQQFNPGRNLQPAVLTPAHIRVVLPSTHRTQAGVIRAKSPAFAPGRVTVLKPAAVAVNPATFSRKP